MWFAADAAAKNACERFFQPWSLAGFLISLLAISSDVPVGLQESNFLFGELADLLKNSAAP